jgi:hypothetical protein
MTTRTKGFSHFNEDFLDKSKNLLDPSTKKSMESIGDKCGAYDGDYLEQIDNKSKSILYNSCGKAVVLDDIYKLKDIIRSIKSGLQLIDLESCEYKLLIRYANTEVLCELEKWIDEYYEN